MLPADQGSQFCSAAGRKVKVVVGTVVRSRPLLRLPRPGPLRVKSCRTVRRGRVTPESCRDSREMRPPPRIVMNRKAMAESKSAALPIGYFPKLTENCSPLWFRSLNALI
jgi:hypothetical protein